MRVRPASDAVWTSSPRPRARVLVLAAVLFGAVAVVQLFVDDPDAPVFLYTLPVVIVALELGVAAGLAAATLALSIDIASTLAKGADLDAVGVVSRAAAFALLGGVVGYLAQSLTDASRRLRAVLDTMRDPFFVYRAVRDGSGRIADFRCEYVNDAASELIGVPHQRHVGAWLSELSPGYLDRPMFGHHRRLVESGEPLAIEEPFGDRVLDVRAVRLGDGFTAAARDITERKRFEARFVQARAELERSNAALTDFAHVVSHELSEPLATVSLLAETLDEHAPAAGDHRVLVQMHEALDRMQERIASLLSFAQVHHAPTPREPVDCAELAGEALVSLSSSMAATDARVDVGPLPIVHGHPEQLALVFENLLSNAVRFRRDGERPVVLLSAARDDGAWHFAITDQGRGVAPGDAERIFEPFVRAAGASTPGTGIGLAVCRKVVELHGGRIWVESEPGRGSTFHFTLP